MSGHDNRKNMELLQSNNISMITLDVRISCDTFWNYSYRIPIRIDDYYDPNTRNINNGRRNQHYRNDDASDTCEIGNIGRRDPMFIELETYLVDYVIQQIYDDIVRRSGHREMPLLLKKARKFHIHGRTLEDILFPNSHSGGTDGHSHSMPENTVYICTHC
jgi:hypothetical protein